MRQCHDVLVLLKFLAKLTMWDWPRFRPSVIKRTGIFRYSGPGERLRLRNRRRCCEVRLTLFTLYSQTRHSHSHGDNVCKYDNYARTGHWRTSLCVSRNQECYHHYEGINTRTHQHHKQISPQMTRHEMLSWADIIWESINEHHIPILHNTGQDITSFLLIFTAVSESVPSWRTRSGSLRTPPWVTLNEPNWMIRSFLLMMKWLIFFVQSGLIGTQKRIPGLSIP